MLVSSLHATARLTLGTSSSLILPRSRSVTSRRNREFSSSSSAIWSPAPHVRSGSLATTRRARRSRDRPGRSGGGLNSGSGVVLLFLFRAVGWASVVAIVWFHSYLVMRARIQASGSNRSHHCILWYSRPSRAGISGRQVAFRNDRDARFARGDAGSGAAVDTRSSPPVHRLRRECCWDVSWYVSGNGRASHCSCGPTVSANPVRDHRTNCVAHDVLAPTKSANSGDCYWNALSSLDATDV